MTCTTPIVAVTRYARGAGSSRVRIDDWADHIGFPVERHTYIGARDNSASTLLRAPARVAAAEFALRRALPSRLRGRTLLLGRAATPFGAGSVERRLISAADRAVYDFDDALYATAPSFARDLASSWAVAVNHADIVIAGNETLAERADEFAQDVRVIPSCVEPTAYVVKTDFSIGAVPRAVWLGTPATESHLVSIAGPLMHLNRSCGLRLTVISRGTAALGALEPMVDRVEWDESLAGRALHFYDFGVMPLRDDDFTRGKCAYKLLQYAAAGLPVIGSPVGANRNVLRLLGGQAPESTHDWIDATASLIGSSAAARSMQGAAARNAVAQHFSFESWAADWAFALGLTP